MRTTHHAARGAFLRAAAVLALPGALALSACTQSGGAQGGASGIAVERPWARAAVQGHGATAGGHPAPQR